MDIDVAAAVPLPSTTDDEEFENEAGPTGEGTPCHTVATSDDVDEGTARKIGKVLSPVLQAQARRQSPRLAARSPLTPTASHHHHHHSNSPKTPTASAAGKKSAVSVTPTHAGTGTSAAASPRSTSTRKITLAAALLSHVRASPKGRQLTDKALTPLRRAVTMVMFSPAGLGGSGTKRVRALPTSVGASLSTSNTPSKLKRSSSRRSVMSEMPTKLWRNQADAELVNSLSKQELKRQETIFELIYTEEEYVTDLAMVLEVFEQPMASLESVSQLDIDILFGSLDLLIQANTTILQALQERQSQQTLVELIGDVLVSKLPMLEDYADYCGNMRRASSRLRSLMQCDDVNALLQECSYLPECRRLGLADFLDMPRRRLLKYNVLLKELVANTPLGHPDHETILAAEKMMMDVAQKVDKEAGAIEKHNRLVEVVCAICSSHKLSQQDREQLENATKIIFEGPMFLAKPAQHVHAVLLDNQFMVLREKEKDHMIAYRFVKDPIPLSDLVVIDMNDSQIETIYSDIKHPIKIMHRSNKDISYIVSAVSQKLKTEWLSYLKPVGSM